MVNGYECSVSSFGGKSSFSNKGNKLLMKFEDDKAMFYSSTISILGFAQDIFWDKNDIQAKLKFSLISEKAQALPASFIIKTNKSNYTIGTKDLLCTKEAYEQERTIRFPKLHYNEYIISFTINFEGSNKSKGNVFLADTVFLISSFNLSSGLQLERILQSSNMRCSAI